MIIHNSNNNDDDDDDDDDGEDNSSILTRCNIHRISGFKIGAAVLNQYYTIKIWSRSTKILLDKNKSE